MNRNAAFSIVLLLIVMLFVQLLTLGIVIDYTHVRQAARAPVVLSSDPMGIYDANGNGIPDMLDSDGDGVPDELEIAPLY